MTLRQFFERIFGTDNLDRRGRCAFGDGDHAATFAMRVLVVFPVLVLALFARCSGRLRSSLLIASLLNRSRLGCLPLFRSLDIVGMGRNFVACLFGTGNGGSEFLVDNSR